MKILISGASGFTGRNLYSLLEEDKSLSLYATDIHKNGGYDNYTCCDLFNLKSVNKLVSKIEPDIIYHLAGTFSNDYETDYAANVLSSKNILEAVNCIHKPCRTVLVGSAAEYGITDKSENPVKETQVLRPASIYGLTKIYQTYLMKYYVQSFGLDIVMARPFNIYGKGMSDKLFVGRVYTQIQMLINGEIKKMQLGNIENERDYISIRNTVKHYVTIMKLGGKGEIYNVGTGIPTKTRAILEKILAQHGFDMDIVESVRSKRDQVYDAPKIYADISKLNQLSGMI